MDPILPIIGSRSEETIAFSYLVLAPEGIFPVIVYDCERLRGNLNDDYIYAGDRKVASPRRVGAAICRELTRYMSETQMDFYAYVRLPIIWCTRQTNIRKLRRRRADCICAKFFGIRRKLKRLRGNSRRLCVDELDMLYTELVGLYV